MVARSPSELARLTVLAAALGLAGPAELQAQSTPSPMPGHERSLTPLNLSERGLPAPAIDGRLDDPAWAQADGSAEFWNSARDRPPTDQTEVLASTDGEYLYFAFRLQDAEPSAIQATRSVRDGDLGYDDKITIELDTFFNRRDISEFTLNPSGTQNDAIAGGRSNKIEWKGDWYGAAVRTASGWSAEFAIPFTILNYDSSTSLFGVNFKRYQSRTRETSYWADITPQSREEEMGRLELPLLPDRRNGTSWTFMPFALAGHNIEDSDGRVERDLVTAGMDIRFQPRAELTSVFSLNPDFSQVEQAITDISFSYSERSLDENRPFFQEGADYFSDKDDDEQYFYSNRIPDFDVGAKSFGRTGRVQYGLLSTSKSNERNDFVGRALFEVDETNSAIAQVVTTNRDNLANTLAVAQFRGRQPSGLNYSFDLAGTRTSSRSLPELPDGSGSHYDGSIGWRSDFFSASVSRDRYQTDFYTANGRIDKDLPGTEGDNLKFGYFRELEHDTLRVVESYAGIHRRDTLSGMRQTDQIYVGGLVEFTNDMRVSFYAENGPYRPVSDVRGVFENELFDDHYASVWLDFNTRSNRYAGGVQYDSGNLGGGPYEYVSAYGWWRPSDTLYFKLAAERIDSFGASSQVVLETTWDISKEYALSSRYIKAEDENLMRVAFSHRPREGLDIFAVYDRTSSALEEISVKLVATF